MNKHDNVQLSGSSATDSALESAPAFDSIPISTNRNDSTVHADSVLALSDSTDVPYFKREGTYLYISKPAMRLYVVNKQDSVLFSCGIACGLRKGDKVEEGDNRTPEGRYRICGMYESTDWIHKTRDGREVKGCYGTYFLSLSTGKFTGIGIHGTNAPRSIGKRASEGCIRVLTPNIEAIFLHFAYNGMRVVISGEQERLPHFTGLGKEFREASTFLRSLSPEQLMHDSLKVDTVSHTNILQPDSTSAALPHQDTVRPDTLPATTPTTY